MSYKSNSAMTATQSPIWQILMWPEGAIKAIQDKKYLSTGVALGVGYYIMTMEGGDAFGESLTLMDYGKAYLGAGVGFYAANQYEGSS